MRALYIAVLDCAIQQKNPSIIFSVQDWWQTVLALGL